MPFRETKNGKPTKRWIGKIVWKGEQVWLGAFGTKTEAKDAEDLERAKRILTERKGYGVETCDSFAARWTTDYPRPKETTNTTNRYAVQKFKAEFREIPLVQVDRPTARAWALRNPACIPAVRAMFNDALNDGLITANPFAGLRMSRPNIRQQTIKVLSRREVYKLADSAPKAHPGPFGEEFRSMLLFAAFCAPRPGELMAIYRTDVDGSELRIERQRNSLNKITTPKNGKSRLVVVPPPAQQALESVPMRSKEMFRAKQGNPFTKGSLFYAWNSVRQKWGRPGFDLHELRHFCATYLLELGLSPADVAEQLGHDDGGALVMSTYGHPDKAKARARILRAFEEVEQSNVVPIRKVEGE